MVKSSYILFIASVCVSVMSCKKDSVSNPEIDVQNERTVIVYMAANNNLRAEALASINQMESSAKGLAGPLLVFVKSSSESSHLLRIRYDESSKIISDTIKSYGNENSSDPAFMKKVLADGQTIEPAKSYGLVLWSHASSWAPPSTVLLKSFGLDRDTEMDIHDLEAALPDNLTYLIFDACSMASVEVIYELKDKARFIIASPTETLAESYPYAEITPFLFGGEAELQQAAEKFVHYYDRQEGLYQSATVSLIKTAELPKLADEVKRLLESGKTMSKYDQASIQRLDFDPYARVASYDLLDFLNERYGKDACAAVSAQLANTILYRNHTKSFVGEPIRCFSGLSCYLPVPHDPYERYYSTLAWFDAGGFLMLFN